MRFVSVTQYDVTTLEARFLAVVDSAGLCHDKPAQHAQSYLLMGNTLAC